MKLRKALACFQLLNVLTQVDRDGGTCVSTTAIDKWKQGHPQANSV
jgi:hypothetical protein